MRAGSIVRAVRHCLFSITKRFRSSIYGRVEPENYCDFAIAQGAGITGFPTLIAGVGEGAPYTLVTQGYQPADRLIPPLTSWLEATRSTIGR